MTTFKNLSTDHMTIEDVFSVEVAMTDDEINEAIQTFVDFGREYAEQEIEGKLENATYPRHGYTTAQVMENEDEYRQWLSEVLAEEVEEYRQFVFDLVKVESDRIAKRDALVETDLTSGTFQNDAKPACPICGHQIHNSEVPEHLMGVIDPEMVTCHHFVGTYNGWYDEDSIEDDCLQDATHMVAISHDTAGVSHWYFATSELDDVMSSSEIADTYGITPDTVRQTIARGAIKARKSGSVWLILRSDAERFWNRNAVKGASTWLVTVLAVLAIVSQL